MRQHPPGTIWSWEDTAFRHGARTQQVERVIAQIARYSGTDLAGLPTALPEAITAFLSAQPIGPSAERRARSTGSRLRPDLRMTELFDEWKAKLQPSEQTAHEFEASMRDFIEMHGDIRVREVVDDDLLNYRDEAAKLPRSMPRSDRILPFTVRVARHERTDVQRITSATLKKRVGALKALLSFAFKQKRVTTNVGVSIPIEGYSRDFGLKPNNFDENQLRELFSSILFVDPASWRNNRKVSDKTLYWLFLLGLTSGARIEEIGQALVSDVKLSGDVLYIDIDRYVDDEIEATKSIKTSGSRRIVPVHDYLRACGFERYAEQIRKTGQVQLFPDLSAGRFGKHSKEASRTANRLIDKLVSKDRRLRFHSFRHQFKDFALEAGITDRVADQLTGHKPTTIGGRYGSGVRLPQLAKFMHQIDWSFINWPAIIVASADMPWNQASE